MLTDKQEQFCKEYIIDLNATQAAIRAGYSSKTAKEIGCENLTKPNIQERLTELMIERSKRNEVDSDWILKSLKDIQERCMQAEPVKDSKGLPTGEWKFDATNAIKATELIGRHIGFFEKDNKQQANEIKIPSWMTVKAEEMTDDELARLISKDEE
jgi:phage terminase small subunit